MKYIIALLLCCQSAYAVTPPTPPIIWKPGPSAQVIADQGLSVDKSVNSKLTAGAASSVIVHQINGGLRHTVNTVSSTYAIDNSTTDYIVLANTSGGAFTVTMPAPTSGRVICIKDSTGSFNTNNLTIAQHAAESIEGLAASKLLTTAWGTWCLFSNGTDWFFL